MTTTDVVRVVFVDAGTGTPMGQSPVPADQLPASFEANTSLQLGGVTWLVESADPPTAPQYLEAGELTLTLRRVETAAPGDILYSLPTICADTPAADAATGRGRRLELHEDDWRQVELVSAALTDSVEEQFDAVRRIHDEHTRRDAEGRLIGFTAIHARAQPARPLPATMSLRGLRTVAPSFSGVVAFQGRPGEVPGSFTLDAAPDILYGLAEGDIVTVLGVASTPHPTALRAIMTTFDLVLVDWCRCEIVRP